MKGIAQHQFLRAHECGRLEVAQIELETVLLAWFAVARSRMPSPLKSRVTIARAPAPASVTLTGSGVSIVPTSFTHHSYSHGNINVTLYAEGDVIPDGEQVQLSCIDWEGANETGGTGTLKNNQATIVFTGGTEDWACGLSYNGDSEFAPSGVSWWLNLCHGSVGACHP